METVFGDLTGLQAGMESALDQIDNRRGRRDLELTRYAVTILYLERKLARQPGMLERIRSVIDAVREQAQSQGTAHAGVLASLADVYKQTVSTLRPQVLVNGNPAVLTDPSNQNLIRTLLLAAIRAAVLWRQCGGRRLTLMLRRKALQEALETLLAESRAGR